MFELENSSNEPFPQGSSEIVIPSTPITESTESPERGESNFDERNAHVPSAEDIERARACAFFSSKCVGSDDTYPPTTFELNDPIDNAIPSPNADDLPTSSVQQSSCDPAEIPDESVVRQLFQDTARQMGYECPPNVNPLEQVFLRSFPYGFSSDILSILNIAPNEFEVHPACQPTIAEPGPSTENSASLHVLEHESMRSNTHLNENKKRPRNCIEEVPPCKLTKYSTHPPSQQLAAAKEIRCQKVAVATGTPSLNTTTEVSSLAPVGGKVELNANCQLASTQKLRFTKGAKPAKYCHVCGRHERSVDVVRCGNISVGLCRKIICEKCLLLHDSCDIDIARDQGSEWSCFHCRGVCPSKARCHQYTRNNERRREKNSERRRAQIEISDTQSDQNAGARNQNDGRVDGNA